MAERRMVAGFVLVVLGASALLLALFAAWGRATAGEPGAAGQRARLRFTGWGGIVEREVFTQLVAEFERRHPAIDVVYQPVPRDYVTKLKLQFAGGNAPDVFYLPDGEFAAFAVAGRLQNLQPSVDRSAVIRPADFWPASLDRYRFDGRIFGRGPLYALPKDIGPTVMFVNLDLLRGEGMVPPSPTTPLDWAEAAALWRRLTRDVDGDGRIDQWGTHGLELESVVWSSGADFLDVAGRRFVMAEDPRALAAAQWLASLQSELRVAPMERNRQSIHVDTLFLTGRLATFCGGRWQVPLFRKARFAWDVVPLPVCPRTRLPGGRSGSVGLAIAPSCRHREAAWQLIEFLAGPEGQRVQARTGFQLPNQQWLAREPDFLQPGQLPAHPEVFSAAAGYERATPATRTPDAEWWDTLHRALGPVYRGETTAAAALQAAHKPIQAALDRAWKVLP